ncbi:MAG: hypothetical protein ACI9JL_001241 [Paracoccaceae bacterium]|jgi:hypothetical protein
MGKPNTSGTLRQNRSRRSPYDFLACALIVLFHFTNYVTYTEYDRIYPDILIVAGGLCILAALLTVFLRVPSRLFRAAIFSVLITFVIGDALFEFGTKDDISLRLVALSATLLVALVVIFFLREHATLVLMGGFLAMLVATVGIGLQTAGPPEPTESSPRQSASTANLPIVVHIILDEHVGLAGMHAGVPGDVAAAESTSRFYTKAGFRLFAGAYSQFFKTETSLAGALNFDTTAQADRFLTRKHYGFSLNENSYLKTYADKGYRIRVYQSDYLDLCGSEGVEVAACATYRPDFLAASAIAELPALERVRLVFGMYYSSIAVIKIAKLAGHQLGRWTETKGVNLPALNLWHGRVGPIAVAPTFEQLIQDVSHARDGTVFFAHFLMPHYPYVYDSDCAVRTPVAAWRLRQNREIENSPDSRRQSYAQYFGQIRCVQKRLDTLFSAMKHAGTFDRATIVVHGDHGARIGLTDPAADTISRLTPADYVDAYSTLFAIKSPDVRGGVDLRMLPLPSLMSYAANRLDAGLSEPLVPEVFIGAGNAVVTPVPLPRFPVLP